MNYKKLFKIILITLLIGNLFSFFIIGNEVYESSIKPPLNPPGIVYGIVWTILYTLMGISLYIVLDKKNGDTSKSAKLYFLQLIVNSTWTLIFFGLNNYLLASIWLVLLIVLVVAMIINFYKVNKKAGLLQIPYLVWLLFALYLNIATVILN